MTATSSAPGTTTFGFDAVEVWPALPSAAWRGTYSTLHMWLQIVGKTRLLFAPHENHWWQVALYLTARGLTTSLIPNGRSSFSIELNFDEHALSVVVSDGRSRRMRLHAMTVAAFYAQYLGLFRELGIDLAIRPVPVEVETAIPFHEDFRQREYDADAANRCWRILLATDRVLKRYRGSFRGKQSPSHFFWGSFDLACTRFSGRPAPRHPGGAPNCPDEVMVEAYSDECASCGFWPGDGTTTEPVFYAYAYPQPPGYATATVEPTAVGYDTNVREFILPYDAVRLSGTPERDLARFFDTTFAAASQLGDWPLARDSHDGAASADVA